jgi:aminomethyltransferase
MGQIEVAGENALQTIQALTTNDASRLAIGQAQYSALTTPAGTVVDDILVYRLAASHYMLVVNATTTTKDFAWVSARSAERGGDVALVNSSARYALIALQGPASLEILSQLTTADLEGMKYYWFGTGEVAGVRATVSRTGYTGEDGFEIFVPSAQADRVWLALLQAGAGHDIRPCGLGARDTLRLEAGMRLYGNEMDESVSAVEAGLGWIVAAGKADFPGAERLRAEKATGPARRVVAFEMTERAIARHGHVVRAGGEAVGHVTSGTQTPFLRKALGFANVPAALAPVGTTLDIDIRGRLARAVVVAEPFYRRPKPAGARS